MRYEDLPDYITVNELKNWLRIGTNKAYELANTRGFPRLKFGAKYVFPKEQVREWLNRQAQNNSLPRKLRAI